MILSPASLVGLRAAETLPDECSRRYADPPGSSSAPPADGGATGSIDGSAGGSVRQSVSSVADAAGGGGDGGGGGSEDHGEKDLDSGAALAAQLNPPTSMRQSYDLVASPARSGVLPAESLRSSAASTWIGGQSGASSLRGSSLRPLSPGSPAPTAQQQLVSHLQTHFSKLDQNGVGAAPTAALLRGLKTLLASQTASLRASRGWAGGIRQVCSHLEAKLEAARLGGDFDAVERLSTGWDELLELSEVVQAEIPSEHPLR